MDPKKRVSSLKQYPVLAAFTLFFAALFVLDLVTPDRAYSELENTTLTQRPKLTAVSVDGLEQLFYELYQICEGSGLRAGPVDQPAEPGRDDPVPEDPERRHPAGAGAPDVCPALPRSAHRRAGLEQESGSGAVAGRALSRQGELHACAVGLRALPGRPAPRCAPDGRGRADRRSAGSAPGGAVSPRHRCAAGAQGRVSVLPHRPPLDDAGSLLRLRAVLRSAGPDAL